MSGAATASGAAVNSRYTRIRLREASIDTDRNSEPTNDRLTIASPKSSTAWVRARRRAKRGPSTNPVTPRQDLVSDRGRGCGELSLLPVTGAEYPPGSCARAGVRRSVNWRDGEASTRCSRSAWPALPCLFVDFLAEPFDVDDFPPEAAAFRFAVEAGAWRLRAVDARAWSLGERAPSWLAWSAAMRSSTFPVGSVGVGSVSSLPRCFASIRLRSSAV